MKKQPQTIADLSFNYTFTSYENDNLFDKEKRFKRQNKSLLKYKIKYQDYKFLINNSEFEVYASGSTRPIESFIEWLNYKLSYLPNLTLPKKLTRFELVEENTFRIHLEEVKPKVVKSVVKK
jgi:hypothetical protein